MTLDDLTVSFAFYALTARYLPLRRGIDWVYVSPEAAVHLPYDSRLGTQIDTRLHGMEMRLQRPSRGAFRG